MYSKGRAGDTDPGSARGAGVEADQCLRPGVARAAEKGSCGGVEDILEQMR